MPFHFSEHFHIADCEIGPGRPVFIIAEAGVAHFGSIEKAMALVDMALAAKANAKANVPISTIIFNTLIFVKLMIICHIIVQAIKLSNKNSLMCDSIQS